MRHLLIIVSLSAWLFVLLGETAGMAAGADAGTVVIAKDVPPDQLTTAHLRNALLGRISLWNDGRPIVIVLSRSPASQDQLQVFIDRDLEHLMRGWKRLVFTGGGSLPEVADDDALAIRRVAATPGAFAVLSGLSAVNLPPGVQRVAIDGQQGAAKPEPALPKP